MADQVQLEASLRAEIARLMIVASEARATVTRLRNKVADAPEAEQQQLVAYIPNRFKLAKII